MKGSKLILRFVLCVAVAAVVFRPVTSYGGIKQYLTKRISAVMKKMVRGESKAAANKAKQEIKQGVSDAELAAVRVATKGLKTNAVNIVNASLNCTTNQVGRTPEIESK